MKSTMTFAIFFLITLSFGSAALRGLSTATLSPSVSIQPWAPSTQYTIGSVVSYNGATYKCIQNHTSLLEWTPNSTPALWQIVNTTCTAVPSAPTGLSASSTTSTGTTLQWSAGAAPAGCSILGYNIFQNGVSIYTGVTGTAYTVTGLSGSTSYSFTVAAIDSAGTSGQSSAISVTTAKAAVHSNPSPSPSPAPSPAPTPSAGSTSSSALVFAPYVDMSLANNNLSAISAASGVKKFTLAFVTGSGCTPQWFSQYTIPGETNIKPIISAFGSDNVIISFGGAVGTELAQSCGTVSGTQAAYQAVIDYYGVQNLDFDIEGGNLGGSSVDIRNQALAGLQAANPGLTISYTLPVLPSGLTYEGTALLQSAAKYGVNVAIVNIMAMDYGSGYDGTKMGQNAISATQAVVSQIASAGLKSRVGITPMIGINDVTSETFSLADAATVKNYAESNPNTVGRLAMWSIARDNGSCVGSVSYGCSGISQNAYDFSKALNV